MGALEAISRALSVAITTKKVYLHAFFEVFYDVLNMICRLLWDV